VGEGLASRLGTSFGLERIAIRGAADVALSRDGSVTSLGLHPAALTCDAATLGLAAYPRLIWRLPPAWQSRSLQVQGCRVGQPRRLAPNWFSPTPRAPSSRSEPARLAGRG